MVSNLPLGLAPGIGLSAYLTYGLVMGEGLTIQEAFTSVNKIVVIVYCYLFVFVTANMFFPQHSVLSRGSRF